MSVNKEKFWENKRVLITGVNGYLGSAMADRLLSKGAKVTGLIRNVNNSQVSSLLEECNVYIGSIEDLNLLREIISTNEIEVIYHFAAYSIVRTSAIDPLSAYRINVNGTLNVLEAARQMGNKAPHCVVFSSDKAYGDHEILPYKENFSLNAINTYDCSKAMADMLAQSYAKTYNMSVAISRSSNVYGPGDFNFSRLIPATIKKLLKNESPVLYSDTETMQREFLFLEDALNAYEILGENTFSGGAVYNIGGNGSMGIREVVETIGRVLGKTDLKPVIVSREFKEIKKQYIDSTKLWNDFGWYPQVSLETGLEETIDWYRELLK